MVIIYEWENEDSPILIKPFHIFMFNKCFRNLTVLLAGVILIFTSILTVTSITARPETVAPSPQKFIELVPVTAPDTTQILIDSLHVELVQHTNEYISKRFPKSKLTGEALVTACIKHDFDICFALAQAEIESGLGTAGKAAKTNSPWNVGAYDSRTAHQMNKLGYGYSHPDQSIEPYIKLVKTKYLGSKRTIHDLMNRYTTLSGYRYASDPNYERSLKSKYREICRRTFLNEIQEKIIRLS